MDAYPQGYESGNTVHEEGMNVPISSSIFFALVWSLGLTFHIYLLHTAALLWSTTFMRFLDEID